MAPEAAAPPGRHFLALVPDESARAALAAVRLPVGARAVSPADLHLTLLFLGTLATDDEARVLDALGGPFAPVPVRLDVAERWPGPRAWVAVPAVEGDAIPALAAALGDRFAVDRREAFRSHVTLARGVPGTPERLPLVPPVEWTAREIVLMASRPGAAPRYVRRGAVALAG